MWVQVLVLTRVHASSMNTFLRIGRYRHTYTSGDRPNDETWHAASGEIYVYLDFRCLHLGQTVFICACTCMNACAFGVET